ncbi:MAG: PAS domain-containing protein [Anditalea sp.]
MSKYFLQGGGAISEGIKAIDWDSNPLGTMEKWPHSLKTSLSISLNSPTPILISWGPQLIMLYNNAYSALVDEDNPLKAIGKPTKECWSEIWDTIGPMLENVKLTGESISLEDQLFPLKRNGLREDRYFTFSYSPIMDEEGIRGVITIVYETTVKVLNDRRTKLEQERYKRFFNQAPAAICILDGPKMIFELVNPAYQQLFPGRELLGKEVLDALPEIKGAPIHDILVNVYHTGETFEGRELLVPLSRYDGAPLENKYFNFIYQARWNDKKEIDGILVLAYEVTDLVAARYSAEQLALKVEQQAKAFDITLTALKDFVYTFDIDGRFTYSNKPLLELLGITLDQIIGKNFHDLPYPSALADTLQSHIAQVIATGKSATDETLYTNPEGKTGHYEYIFTPIYDKEGNVVLVAGSTRDISERHKSEEAMMVKNEALINLNNELIRVNSDLDNFIYTASHDLKAPISNIEGVFNTLTDYLSKPPYENPVVNRLLQMVKTSIDRYNKTIEDLSDISKLQSLREKHVIGTVEFKAVIDDIKLDLYLLIKKYNGQINFEPNGLQKLPFSSKNLRSILYNLISNSLKYKSKDRDPVIFISGKEDPDFYVITVQDNGLGMDLSNEDFIFGMFKRLHNHVEGSGIGLYIVKRIMDNAGGKIEVESKVGEGSTFRLFFKKTNKI